PQAQALGRRANQSLWPHPNEGQFPGGGGRERCPRRKSDRPGGGSGSQGGREVDPHRVGRAGVRSARPDPGVSGDPIRGPEDAGGAPVTLRQVLVPFVRTLGAFQVGVAAYGFFVTPQGLLPAVLAAAGVFWLGRDLHRVPTDLDVLARGYLAP